MANDDKIGEKLQYDINRETTKISPLLSEKIDKYEFLTDEKLPISNWSQIIEQAKFTYSPLGNALEKQTEKHSYALKPLNLSNKRDYILKQIEGIFSRNLLTNLIKNKIQEIVKLK